jgi:hypothetical protein
MYSGGSTRSVCFAVFVQYVAHLLTVATITRQTELTAAETARGAWETCGHNSRSRRTDMLAPLSVEVPALLCVLLRLFSRWWTVSYFEADDYIMMVVTVRAAYQPSSRVLLVTKSGVF